MRTKCKCPFFRWRCWWAAGTRAESHRLLGFGVQSQYWGCTMRKWVLGSREPQRVEYPDLSLNLCGPQLVPKLHTHRVHPKAASRKQHQTVEEAEEHLNRCLCSEESLELEYHPVRETGGYLSLPSKTLHGPHLRSKDYAQGLRIHLNTKSKLKQSHFLSS